MELRQLIYFKTVAEHEHLTKAANQLFIAQSAISKQISTLEKELGAPLFLREGNGIRLSTLGKRFLPFVERILREVELAKQEALHFQNPDSGTIRLGFPHSIGIQFIPNVVAAFRTQFPLIQFDFIQDRVRNLLNHLKTGAIELAIVTPWDPVQNQSGTEGTRTEGKLLFKENLRAVIPSSHALSSKQNLSLADLKNEPFILFKEGYTLRKMVWDACMAEGFEPNIAFVAEETDTIRAFVRAGLGVSLLPPIDGPSDPRVCELELHGEHVSRTVGVVWGQEFEALSGAARRFIEYLTVRE